MFLSWIHVTCSFDCISLDVNTIFHPFLSSCNVSIYLLFSFSTYISLYLPLVCTAFTHYSPLSSSQRFLLPLSFSFLYLKPHVWIVTMCVSEGLQWQLCQAPENFTAMRIGGTDRHTHTFMYCTRLCAARKRMQFQSVQLVSLFKIFSYPGPVKWQHQKPQRPMLLKNISLSPVSFLSALGKHSPSFISYVQPLSCWGIRKSNITQRWVGKDWEEEE